VAQKCQRPENPQHNYLKLLCCGFSGRWHFWANHNTTVLSCCVVGFLDVDSCGPPYQTTLKRFLQEQNLYKRNNTSREPVLVGGVA